MSFIDTFLKLHNTYERKALRMLLKEFQALGKKIPYELLTTENAEGLIRLTLNEAGLEKALFKIYMVIGKSYGNLEARRYRKFREQKKFKPLPLFNEAFQLFIINYFKEFGGENITLLSETYIQAVVSEIVQAKIENETIIQMRDRIFKAVNKPKFYKWQALRIARTETTFAMNSAAMVSSDVSGVVMEKVWYTYRDSLVRDTHRAMEGKVIPSKDLFTLPSGVKMRFPGDKSAIGGRRIAGDLVNCRCSVSHRAKLDGNGLFIFKNDSEIIETKNKNMYSEKDLNKIIADQKDNKGFETDLISDGWHTFGELYEFRKLYNAALFNEWALSGKYEVHKSLKHNDGEYCFGKDKKWFIVSAKLPKGIISNHYKISDWDIFKVPEVEKALFEFDGHTGKDVIERLKDVCS